MASTSTCLDLFADAQLRAKYSPSILRGALRLATITHVTNWQDPQTRLVCKQTDCIMLHGRGMYSLRQCWCLGWQRLLQSWCYWGR